jgi:hypothetical protein
MRNEGGTDNAGTILMDSPVSRLGGGAVTNTGTIRGNGQIDSKLINQAGGEVRVSFDSQLDFTAADNTSAGTVRVVNGGTARFEQGLTNTGQIAGDGTLVFGEIDSFDFQGATGEHLSNAAEMNFSGKTNIFGDVTLSEASSEVIVSGGATATFFDDLVQYGGRIKAASGSNVVYFGALNGFTNLTGAGNHQIEGDFNPGFSPALAPISNITLQEGSTSTFDLSGPTRPVGNPPAKGTHDAWNVSSTLTLKENALIDIVLDNFTESGDLYDPALGDSFELIRFNNLVGDPDSVDYSFPELANESLAWQRDWDMTDGTFSVSVVPEPASLTLMLLGGATLMRRKRRQA